MMGKGPTWTEVENHILKFMFDAGKTDEQIDAVIGRGVKAIKSHRKTMRLVRKIHVSVPKQIVKPIVAPKHSDNLPDVGEQLAKIISLLTDVCLNQKEMYALFVRLENAGKKTDKIVLP